jgi:hypothetical protein
MSSEGECRPKAIYQTTCGNRETSALGGSQGGAVCRLSCHRSIRGEGLVARGIRDM